MAPEGPNIPSRWPLDALAREDCARFFTEAAQPEGVATFKAPPKPEQSNVGCPRKKGFVSSRSAKRVVDRSLQLTRNDAELAENRPGGRVISRQEGQRDVLDTEVVVVASQRLA